MNRIFKMRAEAPIDFVGAWNVVQMVTWSVSGGSMIGCGDCEIVFESAWPLAKIKETLRTVMDGHVMADTVALRKNYTGER